MTALFIVIGSLIGYLAVGLLYARSQMEAAFERARKEWTYEEIVHSSVNAQLAARVLFWPVMMIVDLVKTRLRDWLWQPHTDKVERAKQMAADAKMWREKAADPDASESERQMAAQLADLCQESAKTVLDRQPRDPHADLLGKWTVA